MRYNSERLSKLGRQVTIFFIHDLTRVGMFKNMGGKVGIFQRGGGGGMFDGLEFSGWEFSGYSVNDVWL